MTPSNSSLEISLALCAVTLILITVTFFAVGAFNARRVAVDFAQRAAAKAAESVAIEAGGIFASTEGVLSALGPGIDEPAPAAAQRQLSATMRATLRTMPQLVGLYAIDAHGRRFAGSGAPRSRGPDLGAASVLAYHRAHRDGFLIRPPQPGVAASALVIPVSRRLTRPDGSFGGAIVAEIGVAYLERSLAVLDVGNDGFITLRTDDAIVLARRPQRFLGRRLNSDVFRTENRRRLSGVYLARSYSDGTYRLHAFHRVERFAMTVSVALAQSEYLEQWNATLRVGGLAVTLVMLVIAGMATGIGVQVHRRQRAESAFAQLALVDGLTGLANRRHFDAVFEREWRRAARERASVALLMIDVDFFKAYNDRHGHQQGDHVLRSIAHTIEANIARPGDLAARYGGEEFAVILPGTDGERAIVVAERIRNAVRSSGLPHPDGVEGVVTVSVGASGRAPVPGDERFGLIAAADGALYDAKRSGRNASRTSAAPRRSEATR